MNSPVSLVDELMAQLQGAPLQQMAAQLGSTPAQTQDAVGAALPMLLGALGHNASSPQGAADLMGALQRDHSGTPDLGGLLGSLLGGGQGGSGGGLGGLAGALGGMLGGGQGGAGGGLGGLAGALGGMLGGGAPAASPSQGLPDGGAILGHIFGNKRETAESSLGQATGLGGNAGQLLAMLAPIVMSFLAQRTQSQGLDAGGLGQALGQERARVTQQGGLGGGLLGSLLDQDGDGQVGISDLLKIGGGLLGGRR